MTTLGEAKKKPGRPAKKTQVSSSNNQGISDKPRGESNILEIAYEETNNFKLLFAYYKKLKVERLYMRCTPKETIFFAKNGSDDVFTISKLIGAEINWYYCEREVTMGFNREKLGSIISGIDKDTTKITILKNSESEGILTIILDKDIYGAHDKTDIDIAYYDDDSVLFEKLNNINFETVNYPLQFKLSSSQFKKTVQNINKISASQLTISMMAGHPLELLCDVQGLNQKESYEDPTKIDLIFTGSDQILFNVKVNLSALTPTANSIISDTINFYCSEINDLLTTSISGALQVHTFIKIN